MAIGYSFGALVKTFVQLRDSLGEVAGFNKLALYNAMYPVGIIVSFNTNVDPNTAFPGTTWTQITDYASLRPSSTADIGKTAGSDTFTLAINNLPIHNHTYNGTVSSTDLGTRATTSVGDHTHDFSGVVDNVGNHNHHMNFDTQAAGTHNHTRGSMNITGSISHGNDRTTGDGAFYAGEDQSSDGGLNDHRNDHRILFDASRSWVGNTSDEGNHSHHIDSYTEGSGGHQHGYRGTTTGNGGHSHSVTLGGHNHTFAGTTSNTGSAAAVTSSGKVHYIGAWVRTK